jgi:hypothetical protein
MRGVIGLALCVGIILVLQGCSPPVFQNRFTKAGVSAAAQERDSERCWQIAQKENLPDDVAGQRVVGAFVGGGIVGAMTAAAANESERENPKGPYRGKVHRECMTKRGYSVTTVKVLDSGETVEVKPWKP